MWTFGKKPMPELTLGESQIKTVVKKAPQPLDQKSRLQKGASTKSADRIER